ncbi:hypothetical protein [Exiguobacterium aestuarii]|uniref:hypothetical protein n=1 Tax=Exiguobacterium aestuarii TaxID=273527 RepID=UPI001CD29561|nr:hypothetical protein [Exiguobacterium aestuarii]MCA0981218.1 hypothetical protein [Exiguobacterium aestuarii]
MHVSERLLQLYATLDRQTRDVVQQRIETNLADGKSLAASYHELTGETNDSLSVEEKSATDFSNWLKEGKTELVFLTYYVALLEKREKLQSEGVIPQTVESIVPKPITQPSPQETMKSEIETPANPTPTKPRYVPVPDSAIPSRTERLKSYREIKPARPRRKKSHDWLLGLIAIILLSVGSYAAYPTVKDLLQPPPASTKATEAVAPEPEPVAETKALEEVWIGVKHAPLLSEPNSEDVVYVADIGDRYDVLEERDDALLLDLGVNDLTGWVSREEVVTEWSGLSISDPDLLKWLTVGVDQVYLYEPAEAYLEMTRDQLVEVVGEPYGLDSDDLNEYLIYNGIFFTIQNGRVEAIDWPSTIQTKEMFLKLGEPTYEIEDGVVYESQNYSLRLFVKENESTRVRVTKLDN